MNSPWQAGIPDYTERPRLLIVDDQTLNIRLLHDLFHEDFNLFMATDGYQAIDKAGELLPDLILLDVMMPGMDGYEVCRRLKDDDKTAHIPIIFITANHDEEDEVKGFEMGGSDFIHKPINAIITKARVNTHLALKKQTDALRDIALIDGLTGIANRRKFELDFTAAWRDCKRNQVPLSLVMADVDFFKNYNDHYGHQKGDLCLQWVARALKQALLRPKDMVARYGGEEFVCVLPDTDAEGAMYVAQQLLEAVRNLKLEHACSDVGEHVTMSLGAVTQVPSVDFIPEQLMEKADQQLYAAKNAGRNRICAFELPSSHASGTDAREQPSS